MAAVLLIVVFVADGLGAEGTPLRQLRGNELVAAREARDQADLMRAELEGRLSGPPEERPPISQEEIEVEAAKIEQAYQEVIDRYPHTEIAAYCAMCLSGHYIFHGKIDTAVELMEQTAKEFSETPVANETIFEMGLIHLQSRHDPAEAIKWFSRIPKPGNSAGAEYGLDDKLYLSAQLLLVKCELQLSRDDKAQDRVSELKNAYPQYAQETEHSYQFEVEARNSSGDEPQMPLNQKPWQSNFYKLFATVTLSVILIIIFIFRDIQKRRRIS